MRTPALFVGIVLVYSFGQACKPAAPSASVAADTGLAGSGQGECLALDPAEVMPVQLARDGAGLLAQLDGALGQAGAGVGPQEPGFALDGTGAPMTSDPLVALDKELADLQTRMNDQDRINAINQNIVGYRAMAHDANAEIGKIEDAIAAKGAEAQAALAAHRQAFADGQTMVAANELARAQGIRSELAAALARKSDLERGLGDLYREIARLSTARQLCRQRIDGGTPVAGREFLLRDQRANQILAQVAALASYQDFTSDRQFGADSRYIEDLLCRNAGFDCGRNHRLDVQGEPGILTVKLVESGVELARLSLRLDIDRGTDIVRLLVAPKR